jgi:hypothetical protein
MEEFVMKKMFIILLAMAFVFAGSSAFAFGDTDVDVEGNITLVGDKNKIDNKKGIINTGTMDNDLFDVDNEINADFQNNQNNYNSDFNMNTNKNYNSDYNSNTNKNYNSDFNSNVNLQGNKQVMVYKEAKNPIDYDHIDSGVKKTDADMAEQKEDVSTIRTLSSIFKYDDDNFITMAEAKKASSGADIDVEKALLWTPKIDGKELTLENLNYVETTGKYLGSLTLTTEDATADQMLAQAAEEAMKAGATSAIFTVKDAKQISGSKYGIDLGSSASVALNPDTGSAVIAPGSTLGWSKAKSKNVLVSEVYVELFFDATLIKAE